MTVGSQNGNSRARVSVASTGEFWLPHRFPHTLTRCQPLQLPPPGCTHRLPRPSACLARHHNVSAPAHTSQAPCHVIGDSGRTLDAFSRGRDLGVETRDLWVETRCIEMEVGGWELVERVATVRLRIPWLPTPDYFITGNVHRLTRNTRGHLHLLTLRITAVLVDLLHAHKCPSSLYSMLLA